MMKIIVETIEINYELEKIKLEIACLTERKLREVFPENYKENSTTKIFIDTSLDPMKIIATTNNDLSTESRIGKIELNLTETEEMYSAMPIITIWTIPLKDPISIKFF